ncbi:hypothetical protein GQ54DRAFT_341724 [Martensiomyces pterosporus]|nr:hypothetical protein GQ54DRAFT_341724 [Martensiomyces pterosporus]
MAAKLLCVPKPLPSNSSIFLSVRSACVLDSIVTTDNTIDTHAWTHIKGGYSIHCQPPPILSPSPKHGTSTAIQFAQAISDDRGSNAGIAFALGKGSGMAAVQLMLSVIVRALALLALPSSTLHKQAAAKEAKSSAIATRAEHQPKASAAAMLALLGISALATALTAASTLLSGAPLHLAEPVIPTVHLAYDVLGFCRQWHILREIHAPCSSDQQQHMASDEPNYYCPEESESLFARLTYNWVYRYLTATDADLPVEKSLLSLPLPLQPSYTLAQFNKCWVAEAGTLQPSTLARVLVRTFISDLCLSSGLRLIVYFNEVALPLLVARLLHEIGSSHELFSLNRAALALALYTLLSLIATLVEQNQVDIRDKAILKIRLTLTAAIHQRSLQRPGLVAAARAQGTDLYSCGTQSTAQLARHIVTLGEALWLPLRVTAGLYVFYQQVGWAVLPGIAAILLYLPVRKHLVRRITRLRGMAERTSSERIQLLTQLFENIVSIRLLGWESHLVKRIQALRAGDELAFTLASRLAATLLTVACTACRSGGPLVSLFIYSTLSHYLSSYYYRNPPPTQADSATDSGQPFFVTAERVYIVQAILRELFPLLIDVPHAFDSWWAAKQPYAHINQLLAEGEHRSGKKCAKDADESGDDVVRITSGRFGWTTTKPATATATAALSQVDLRCGRGQMVAVVGKVGAGKSSLLSAILGEMDHLDGHKYLAPDTRIAYVSQSPWLMNASIRENITFGQPYDPAWYAEVVEACELRYDLDRLLLPLGDQTVVGNNGITLSGGQRVRVALARAVYARAGLYLLDDVLAAVDAHVGHRLFTAVMSSSTGLLRDCARIVVAKEGHVIAEADSVYLVAGNAVRVSENREEKRLVAAVSKEHDGMLPVASQKPSCPLLLATPPNSAKPERANLPTSKDDATAAAPPPKPGSVQEGAGPANHQSGDSKPAQKRQGRVEQYMVPVRYMLRLCGGYIIAAHLLTVAGQSLVSRQAQLWLGKPIPLVEFQQQQQHTSEADSTMLLLGRTNPTLSHFIVCAAWWAADISLEFGSHWWTEVAWKRAIFTKSHSDLLTSISHAPLSFFSSSLMSTGAILSLFSDSQKDMDTRLPQRMANVTTYGIKLIFESWVIMRFHPILVLAIFVVVVLMKRIVDVSQGPLERYINLQGMANPRIHEQFQQSLDGATTIRAFAAHQHMESLMAERLDLFARAQRSEDSIETWIDLTMSLMRACVTSVAFAIALATCVATGLAVDATYLSIVHMCTTFHLARLQHLTRKAHEMRSSFIRARRFIEYTQLDSGQQNRRKKESEAPCDKEEHQEWPNEATGGHIVFERVSARYSKDAKLALNNISFAIQPGQHIGIAGRTGSGKTSIVMALFGLLPLDEGTVTIDGRDISTISAHALHSKLAIVPQSPVHMVLPGTIRTNLDPLSKHSTEEIQKALDTVGLGQLDMNTQHPQQRPGPGR